MDYDFSINTLTKGGITAKHRQLEVETMQFFYSLFRFLIYRYDYVVVNLIQGSKCPASLNFKKL